MMGVPIPMPILTKQELDESIERFRNSNKKEENGDSAGEQVTEGVGAKVPVGRRGNPIVVKPETNEPATIGGRNYSGHALDRMQGRGVPPSAVEEAIKNGVTKVGKVPDTFEHVMSGVKVITNIKGEVVTVIPR